MEKLSRITLETIDRLIPNALELESKGKLQNIGGCSFVADCTLFVPELIAKTNNPKKKTKIPLRKHLSSQDLLNYIDALLKETNKYLVEISYSPGYRLQGTLYQKIE